MQLSIRTKVAIFFSVIAVSLLVNYYIIRSETRYSLQQLSWVEHTYEVIHVSELLLGHLRDAETGQRGYLLTQQRDYLEPYEYGISSARETLVALQQLVTDNPEQQQRLEALSVLIDQKFAELAKTVGLTSQGDFTRAIAIVNSNEGKQFMDEIRAQIHYFVDVERMLLAEREAAYQKSQKELQQLFVAERLGALLLIIISFLYLHKTILSPIIAMAREADLAQSRGHRFEVDFVSDDEIGALSKALKTMHEVISQRTEDLQEMSERLRDDRDTAVMSSRTDPLTGLYNRRYFDEIASRTLRQARRDGSVFCLILIDIDYFKMVNDTYGHKRGDKVLKMIAETLQSKARRPNDFLFRLGGEEFLFLSSSQHETVESQALFAEELRKAIAALRIPNEQCEVSSNVTISAGVVSVIPRAEDTVGKLLEVADKRLYQAKRMGRNRVVTA